MPQYNNQPAPRKLVRTSWDTKLGGVCGGFARYFDVDVTVLRILVFALIVLTGIFPGVLIYAFAWMAMPSDVDEPTQGERAEPHPKVAKSFQQS